MPGFLDIRVTTRKNGQQVAWFKDTLGRRVGTSAAGARMIDAKRGVITSPEQMAWLANYYIELQNEQLDAGIGSNGQPMPPLSTKQHPIFVTDPATGKRRFVRMSAERGYQSQKQRRGLRPIRDLYGPGVGGHMRDDIRINYVDDRMAKISITRALSRKKALANERRAAWWGLSPANARKFAQAQATVYGGAVEDWLDSLGLVQAGNYMVQLARLLNARKRSLARRAA